MVHVQLLGSAELIIGDEGSFPEELTIIIPDKIFGLNWTYTYVRNVRIAQHSGRIGSVFFPLDVFLQEFLSEKQQVFSITSKFLRIQVTDLQSITVEVA